jgi:hypothetical protein
MCLLLCLHLWRRHGYLCLLGEHPGFWGKSSGFAVDKRSLHHQEVTLRAILGYLNLTCSVVSQALLEEKRGGCSWSDSTRLQSSRVCALKTPRMLSPS